MDDSGALVKLLDRIASGPSSLAQVLRDLRPGLGIASKARGEAKAFAIAKEAAESVYRQEIERGVREETALSLAELAAKAVRGNARFAETVADAAKQVVDFEKAQKNAELIDEGWINTFSDYSGREADEELRYEWSKLLAGELDNPGTYSKRSLSILADMSKSDAKAFAKLCGNCIATKIASNGKVEPILTMSGFNSLPLSDEEKLSLNALGLTSFSFGMLSASRASFDTEIAIRIGKNEYVVRKAPDGPDSIEVVRNIFTKFGLELAGLCEIGSNACFEDNETQALAIQGFEVIRVAEWLPGGQRYRGTRIEPDAGRVKDPDGIPTMQGTWKPLVPDIQAGGFRLTE